MRTNNVGNRAILLSMIALLSIFGCDEELVPFVAFRADVEIEEDELEVEGRFTCWAEPLWWSVFVPSSSTATKWPFSQTTIGSRRLNRPGEGLFDLRTWKG